MTTLMLLLRAFYSKFGHMQDKASISTKQNIEKCLWKTDEFGEPDMSQLKIDSEVATDNDKEEFLEILRTGIVNKEMKSKYALQISDSFRIILMNFCPNILLTLLIYLPYYE